jgi:hypothetical protein
MVLGLAARRNTEPFDFGNDCQPKPAPDLDSAGRGHGGQRDSKFHISNRGKIEKLIIAGAIMFFIGPNEIKVQGDPSNKKCPYCGFEFPQKPTRKKTCPSCAQTVIVRQGILLTVEEASIEDWLKIENFLALDRKGFREFQKKVSEQTNIKASVHETCWFILRHFMSLTTKAHEKKWLYLGMSRLSRMEGKSGKDFLACAFKVELLDWKANDVTKVKISTVNDDGVCKKCKSMSKKAIPIDQAIAELPVPYACDSEDGCRCSYTPC